MKEFISHVRLSNAFFHLFIRANFKSLFILYVSTIFNCLILKQNFRVSLAEQFIWSLKTKLFSFIL